MEKKLKPGDTGATAVGLAPLTGVSKFMSMSTQHQQQHTDHTLLGLAPKVFVAGVEIQDPAIHISIEFQHLVILHAEVGSKTLMLLDVKHTTNLLVPGFTNWPAIDKIATVDKDERDTDAMGACPRQDQEALRPKVGDGDLFRITPGHVHVAARLLKGQPLEQIAEQGVWIISTAPRDKTPLTLHRKG